MSRIESLMSLRASSPYGWTKINHPSNHRVIRIGNASNCNDDSIICDLKLKQNIENVLRKYNISDESYILNEIKNKYEYSYEVKVSESSYEHLVNNWVK